MSELKQLIGETTITAMKARQKERVAALRMVNAEIKRVEVDDRRELSDADILSILNKMLKQRHDSLSQFQNAGRDDLAQQERFEIDLIQEFLPAALSDEEVDELVTQLITQTGASSMQDMGKVMAKLKQTNPGQIDMGKASALVKEKLA
ncbi:MAG: GatB/YqeY domain-containing protein [Gammaproteobacteria bacterium]|nr:GatB/YqeY domain-containing protein [Gammaproteobacteria bacterium]